MITENEYLKAKEIIAQYEKEQKEMKELLSKETMKKAIIDAYDQGRSDEETRFPFADDGEDYYSLKILNASSKAE